MNRRDLMTLLGGAAVWPVAARAQQAAMPVIGYLGARSAETDGVFVAEFQRGLGEAGYVAGRNLEIEYRWADNQYDRLPTLAGDLIRRGVTVMVASGTAAAVAKAATTTVPIVFTVGVDPVAIGLVPNLSRPGGNLTGVTTLGTEVGPKKVELLHELIPNATAIGLLVNPTGPTTEAQLREIQAAARAFGLQLHILHASDARDFEAVFASLVQLRAGGLVIGIDPLFTGQGERLALLALRHAIPAIHNLEFVLAGGLMGYGGSNVEGYHLVGVYTGRILKGEKPGDLPVQRSTKIELNINLKTARALGITVPLALLTRADEVIE
jgi:putative ABC transport system substrate-binding protein